MDWSFCSPRPWYIIWEASKPFIANFIACSPQMRSIICEWAKKRSRLVITHSTSSLEVSLFPETPTVYRKQRPVVALSQIFKSYSLPQGKKPSYCSSTNYSVEFLHGYPVPYLGSFPSRVLPKAKTADEFLLIPSKILQIISNNLRLCWRADYTVHENSYTIHASGFCWIWSYTHIRLPLPLPPLAFSPFPSLKKRTTNNFLGLVEQ